MKIRIAILRGINVGGKRKILMKDLKELFLKLGHTNIQTYIQSGNVVFESSGEFSNFKTANKIENAIFKKFGFGVPVIVLSAKELNAAISENPFFATKSIEIERLHLTFLKERPVEEETRVIEALDFAPDKFIIKNKTVFIYCAGKYHQSKLTNNFFESKLKVQATTRNWKTVLKLAELSTI